MLVDGRSFPGALVVGSIGVRPDIRLAELAGRPELICLPLVRPADLVSALANVEEGHTGASEKLLRLLAKHLDMPLDEALDYLRAQLSLAFSTDDIREGATAFFEKREPVWKGH